MGEQTCGNPSWSYARLAVRRRCVYDKEVSVFKNRVKASTRSENSKLRFQTDISQTETHENGTLYINIYNEREKRYICFNRIGHLRTLKKLPRNKRTRHRRLTCRFVEQMVRDGCGQQQSHLLTMYMADEPHRPRRQRALTFCPDQRAKQQAKLRWWGRMARRLERKIRQQCDKRCRRGSRRRHRQERSASSRRRQQRWMGHQCQYLFMKKALLDSDRAH